MPGAITLLPLVWDWDSVMHVLYKLDADPDATDVLQRRIADWFSGCVLTFDHDHAGVVMTMVVLVLVGWPKCLFQPVPSPFTCMIAPRL